MTAIVKVFMVEDHYSGAPIPGRGRAFGLPKLREVQVPNDELIARIGAVAREDISAADQRMAVAVAAAIAAEHRIEDRLTESMRDMQSEVLRGLERFARGNFARLHALDTRASGADQQLSAFNERITALEEPVLHLDTRTPPEQH
jgi:hypothetical protein